MGRYSRIQTDVLKKPSSSELIHVCGPARGGNGLCLKHGGGGGCRCEHPGCDESARSGYQHCVAHGRQSADSTPHCTPTHRVRLTEIAKTCCVAYGNRCGVNVCGDKKYKLGTSIDVDINASDGRRLPSALHRNLAGNS